MLSNPTSLESKSSFDKNKFLSDMDRNGYAVFEQMLPAEFVAVLREELESAIEQEAAYHKTKDYRDYGMVLFCPLYGSSFIKLLDHKPFLEPAEAYMGEASIVYSYTSSSMPPQNGNYSTRVHNDCSHTIPADYPTRLGVFVMLDDFTEENGATWIIPGSHKQEQAPTDDEFYSQAKRVAFKAGTVWYAHPKIWHAGGINKTNRWRHGVTVGFCRAYMKQRLDIPRMLADRDLSMYSDKVRQKLGFYAQVPTSYEEYHLPVEHRKFRQSVE